MKRWIRIGLAAAVACSAALAGGCASISEEEYQAALAENQELRERLTTLDQSLDRCEADRTGLEAENAQLSSEVQRLDAALRQARAAAAQPRAAATGDGGFGGIEGATVSRRGESTVVTVAGDVLFASGRDELRAEARRTLDRVADVIRQRYPNNTIRVEGYTDTDPIRRSGWKSNEHLSAYRALAVEQYLVSRGLNNDRIYSAAFGPALPRATKAASRRVEIVVLAD
ncbi:MAG: hypothetical protein EA378_05080 [Phycisphaerales bacterium]|nr:MAG: hypothetical protein EA378_05080 [Phycisphaerales bacterium]